jgi:hypothetical protein
MITPRERKRAIKIARLDSLDGVAAELGRVYRESRRSELDSSTAWRLSSILSVIAKTLETSVLEKRLNEIEQTLLARERPFRPKVVL